MRAHMDVGVGTQHECDAAYEDPEQAMPVMRTICSLRETASGGIQRKIGRAALRRSSPIVPAADAIGGHRTPIGTCGTGQLADGESSAELKALSSSADGAEHHTAEQQPHSRDVHQRR